jgi:predicted secreted Zn-dependent protease
MLQKLLLVIFTSLLSVPFSDDNLIDWSVSRKLTWSDFRAKPDPSSANAALTSSTINVEFGYDKNGFKHSITCRFDKSKSWVRVKNDYILNHEQGHFDLAEAYARELHKEFQEYKFRKESASDDLNKIYSRVMQKHIEAQDRYDKQTDHSLDTAKQSAWDVKIRSMLKEFETFKDYK